MTRSNPIETIGKLFEHAIAIEYKAADIYEIFSRMFSHVAGLHDFWQGMRNDEVGHATRLEAIHQSLSLERLGQIADKKMWNRVMRTRQMFGTALADAIETLDDAYELAHEIEYSEVNAIFKFLATEFVTDVDQEAFVYSQITQHQQKLSDFNQRFGDRESRKKIKARITGGRVSS
jgi:hypothetical protein